MKRNVCIGILVFVITAQWVFMSRTKTHMTPETPTLEDSILQMSAADKWIYGDTEENQVLYNLVMFRKLGIAAEQDRKEQKKTIEQLVKDIEQLEKKGAGDGK